MIHKNAGHHYTHGYNKIHRHSNNVKDLYNNGVATVKPYLEKLENVARTTDKVIRCAYEGYRLLEPFLPVDGEVKMGVRTFMSQYDQTANRVRESYTIPVRELLLPRVREAVHAAARPAGAITNRVIAT